MYTPRQTLLIMLGELNNWASYMDNKQYTRKQAATLLAENIMSYIDDPEHITEREVVYWEKVLKNMKENWTLFQNLK